MSARDIGAGIAGIAIGIVIGMALSLSISMAVDMAAGPGPERFGWPSDYERRDLRP